MARGTRLIYFFGMSYLRVLSAPQSRAAKARHGLTFPYGAGSMVVPVSAEGLLIGEVARQSGVSRKALRLYESLGIMPAPRRTPAGYRVYPRDALRVVAFVGQGRRLGLTLSEIKHVVALRRAGTAPCRTSARYSNGRRLT